MSKNLYYQDEELRKKFDFNMLKRLFIYVKQYKKEYMVVLILIGIDIVLSLVPPSLNAWIINDVLPFNGKLQDKYLRTAVIVLLIWASVLCWRIISSFFHTKLTIKLGNEIVFRIRQDLFKHLMKLGFDFYDSRPVGKILVRITNYTSEVADIFASHLTSIMINGILMAATLFGICVMDIRLGLAVMIAEIPFSVILCLLMKELQKRSRNNKSKMSNRTAFITEDIAGVEIIKSFSREKINKQILVKLSDDVLKSHMHFVRINEAVYPLSHGIIQAVCSVFLYTVALWIITQNNSSLSLGVLVGITTYMQMFAEALFIVCKKIQNISTLTNNLERIFEVMDTEPQVKDSEDSYELPSVKGDISFHNVFFSYDGRNNILQNISFSVKQGEMIAIVGPTGAGKTTIVNLLCRFYNVDSGKICIDEHNINHVTLKSLRSQIGVMVQDAFLFSGEIIENIRFSKPTATDDECIEAAKKVYADDFIRKLPNGYHTKIKSNSLELSCGERQLVSLARLILAEPKIVIMDEATSNIDTQTEYKIQLALKNVLKNKTSFIIAHRLSTIKDADKIFYVENSKIVESGNHEELMSLKGKYYSLISNY